MPNKRTPEQLERQREYQRKYYARVKDNPDFKQKAKEAQKTWHKKKLDDPEYRRRRNDYFRAYAKRMKDDPEFKRRKLERTARAYTKHLEREGRPIYAKEGNLKKSYIGSKARAKKKGLEFTIAYGDLEQPTHCPILGIELDYHVRKTHQPNSPTIDRIDNCRGYVKGNVHVISMLANKMKNNSTLEQCVMLGKWAEAYLTNSREAERSDPDVSEGQGC